MDGDSVFVVVTVIKRDAFFLFDCKFYNNISNSKRNRGKCHNNGNTKRPLSLFFRFSHFTFDKIDLSDIKHFQTILKRISFKTARSFALMTTSTTNIFFDNDNDYDDDDVVVLFFFLLLLLYYLQ